MATRTVQASPSFPAVDALIVDEDHENANQKDVNVELSVCLKRFHPKNK